MGQVGQVRVATWSVIIILTSDLWLLSAVNSNRERRCTWQTYLWLESELSPYDNMMQVKRSSLLYHTMVLDRYLCQYLDFTSPVSWTIMSCVNCYCYLYRWERCKLSRTEAKSPWSLSSWSHVTDLNQLHATWAPRALTVGESLSYVLSWSGMLVRESGDLLILE